MAATREASPGTGRTDPSSPSSPTNPTPATHCDGNSSAATSNPMAMGRSRPAPDFRIPDGARLTVTRRDGHERWLDSSAALTRSRDSRTAASGNPTMVKPGSPADTWTSTETGRPSTPYRVADGMQASMTAPDGIGAGDGVRAVSVRGAALLRRRPHEAQKRTIRRRCITVRTVTPPQSRDISPEVNNLDREQSRRPRDAGPIGPGRLELQMLRTGTGVTILLEIFRRSSGSVVSRVEVVTAAHTTRCASTTSEVTALPRRAPTSCAWSGENATTSQPRRKRRSCACRGDRLT